MAAKKSIKKSDRNLKQTSAETFAKKLVSWYKKYGHSDLPWQINPTLYRVWVSEIMLQQTQVASVIPYYKTFIKRFPSLKQLAEAEVDEVLTYWSGLGYYARARNLHRAAQLIRDQYSGRFPTDIDEIQSLPGIGRSTAGAILALSKQQRHPILDGNVKRVLCRYFAVKGWPGENSVTDVLWQYSEQLTPSNNIRFYTQAIMDLGATLCTRSKPQCLLCPFNATCEAYRLQQVDKFPQPKPKKQIPTRQVCMLMLEDKHQQLLLIKRPPSGIWGGLYSFPECGIDEDAVDWCQKNLGIKVKTVKSLPEFKHSFSHYHLKIKPIKLKVDDYYDRVMEDEDSIWYKRTGNQRVAYATPVKHLLQTLD